MKRFVQLDENELVRICLIYRYISLIVSTLVYFFMYKEQITPIRMGIATGIVLASTIGAQLYKKNFSSDTKAEVIVTMCLEVVAYGLFITFSGGFSSPYLWYFISSLTIVMAADRFDKRLRIITPLSVVWCFICALIGSYYGLSPDYEAYSGINTGIAFLVVAGGFYTLFSYVYKLDNNRRELSKLNESLQIETIRSEQALRHTMDLYEAFNLFSITAPDKVIEEITALLYRTIATGGFLLLKINLLQGIEYIGSRGLPEGHEEALIEHIRELEQIDSNRLNIDIIEVSENRYTLAYISNSSNIQGILITPFQAEDKQRKYDKAQELFYLNLVGIIMQELDLQAMVESFIVSEEQNRIANEIHDTVIQKLFAIACNLRLLDEEQGNMPQDKASEQLKHNIKAIESTMSELREAIYGLRWDTADQNPFADKLNDYMEEVRYLSGAAISLVLNSGTELMTANQKTAFYRIICEAVNNAIRHGKATEINVQVRSENKKLTAEIIDNGQGFDQRRISKSGQGLKNMYRVATLLKGQLVIESQINRGTKIKCSLPM